MAKGKNTRRARPSQRVDWRKVPAPAKGSPKRAAYERSAVYRERQEAARRAHETRQRKAAQKARIEKAKKRRKALMREMRRELRPKVERMLREAERGGDFWTRTRELHKDYTRAKLEWGDLLDEGDYLHVLEQISDDEDLDEIGWDIIY